MKLTHKLQTRMRLTGAGAVVIVLVITGLLLWLNTLYSWQADLTRSGRNTLSEASIAVLEKMGKELHVTVFASLKGELRLNIDKLLNAYRRHKKDIRVEYVDPDTEPQRARKTGIQADGQLLLSYEGSTELLTTLSEESFTNALTRLGHKGERWIVFLDGHGERNPHRGANFDISVWAKELQQRGFRVRSLALSESPGIPNNTSLLVIAGPQTPVLAGEAKLIDNYVRQGGNLLWLHDPGSPHGLDRLMEQIGIEFHPGIVIDPESQRISNSATAVVVGKYGSHPIVRDFALQTVFPVACGISLEPDEGWQHSVLLDTRASAWSETGPLDTRVQRNAGSDIPGPLNLGVALAREQETGEQRVVVICDGDFLSNTFIGNGGNMQLGMSIANWLSHDDAYVNIPVGTTPDASLELSITTQNVLGIMFVLVIPISLVASGILIWLRRRRR